MSASLRAALRGGDRVLRSLIVEFHDPGLVELCATLGYDLLIIDGEHYPFGPGLADLVRAAELHGTPVIVRAGTDMELGPYIEAGVAGVHLAQAETLAQVERVVQALKFRPVGRRGAGVTRIARYGMTRQDLAFTGQINDATLLLVALETPEGVAVASEIAAHPAVDALLAGTGDLSHSLGVPSERGHPRVLDAVAEIRGAAQAHGKGFALPYSTRADAAAAVERGATLLLTSLAGLVRSSAAADLEP